MSYQYFKENPCFKKSFRPFETSGKAINGSKVLSVGEVDLKFRMQGVHMQISCKVIKGLMDPIVLGWDWMYKYKAMLDPANGKLHFMGGRIAPLIENTHFVTGCFYRVYEDLTVPPNCKMHTEVELILDKEFSDRATTTVIAEPFTNNGSDVWSCRACSTVNGGKFMMEFINCCEYSVKLDAGQVLGYAEFVQDNDVLDAAVHTEMQCSYKSDDSAYESGEDTECDDEKSDVDDDEPCEEVICDKPPKHVPKELPDKVPLSGGGSQKPDHSEEPILSSHHCDEIPDGAKPLHIDYSTVARDAEPHLEKLKELLEVKHSAAFSKHDRDYGKTSLIQYRAHLKEGDDNPIAMPPYRTRPEMREVIDKQAHEMIADGLVGHSTSAYSAPIMLAKKKCGGWRFLTDFRKVNERCNKVVYPLPRIEDSIQRLDNPKFFSTMDLTKGFWQIPIHPADRKYFAFSTESMHLEYLVAPMGAKNSPSYLTALMQLVLRGLPAQHIISYLDDILVADGDMDSHLGHLDQVLTALERAGLKLNPAKCSFAQKSVICLGHKLSRDGVAPDPANIAKIKSWKPPGNAKRLRSFLGLTGYYRVYVKSYSDIAGCLTDLTRDDVKWRWDEKHQLAFDKLKAILVSDLIMNYPDFSKPFIVKADASLASIGYVLTQKFDGREKVISYGSKKLSRPQQNWCTYDREFFALLSAIRANSHYLRHAKFSAITDHRPLLAWRKVDAKKDPTGRRTRWAIELDNYEFELIHKKGKMHADADAMSRRGDDDDEVAEDDDEFCCFKGHESDEADSVAEDDHLFLSQEEQEAEANGSFLFLGMAEEDEYSAAKFNSEFGPMRRLRRRQNADSIIMEVIGFARLRRRLPRSFPNAWYKRNIKWLIVRDGILYRKSYSEAVHSPVLQAVIPDSMVQEVLSDLHGSEWSGHPSATKMQLKVQRYAVWPTMPRDIRNAVKDCRVCDQVREQVPKPVTPLQPIVAKRVFDHVMCDLIAFPVVSYGFKYVLIFKDVFSGYVKFYKLRNKTSDGVVKAFEDLTCSLGPPKLLTSDNGGEFVSGALKLACELKGTAKRTSVAYRPQSQGNVERQNRILIQDLQKRLIQYGKSWVEHLPYVEWLHNTTPFAKTRMSPYFLFFGREPYIPPFVDVEVDDIKDVNNRKYLKKLKDRMENIYQEANRRAEEKRAKEAAYYNKKAKHVPFEKGDEAWEKVNVRHKLNPKWTGPLRVMERRPSASGDPGTTYVCQRQDGTLLERNYEQLKRVLAKAKEVRHELALEIQTEKDEADFSSLLAVVFAAAPGDPPEDVAPARVPDAPPLAENDDDEDLLGGIFEELEMAQLPQAPIPEVDDMVPDPPAVVMPPPAVLEPAVEVPTLMQEAEPTAEGEAEPALGLAVPVVIGRPLSPPPHPLIAEIDSSPEFLTPPAALKLGRVPSVVINPCALGGLNETSPSGRTEGPLPDAPSSTDLLQEPREVRIPKNRRRRARRSISLLPTDLDEHSDEPATSDDEVKVKAEPSDSLSSEGNTALYLGSDTEELPRNVPAVPCSLTHSPLIPRRATAIVLSPAEPLRNHDKPSCSSAEDMREGENIENEAEVVPKPEVALQTIRLEVPQEDLLALPSTSSGNHGLVTKIRPRDNRSRAHSSDPAYPRAGAGYEKSKWVRKEKMAERLKASSVPTRSATPAADAPTASTAAAAAPSRVVPRGPGGRFVKTNDADPKPKKATGSEGTAKTIQPELPG